MKNANTHKNAKKNGQKAELYALKQYKNMILIDDLADAILNDTIVEIKSCQKIIKDVSHKYTKRRSGRFILNRKQHEHLLKNNGYYLFILFDKNEVIAHKLIKAEKIEFKNVLCWKRIFNEYDK